MSAKRPECNGLWDLRGEPLGLRVRTRALCFFFEGEGSQGRLRVARFSDVIQGDRGLLEGLNECRAAWYLDLCRCPLLHRAPQSRLYYVLQSRLLKKWIPNLSFSGDIGHWRLVILQVLLSKVKQCAVGSSLRFRGGVRCTLRQQPQHLRYAGRIMKENSP